MQMDEFLKKIRMRAGMRSNEEAKNGVQAVLETLKTRITHEAGNDVASQLPKELKEMWESSLLERLQRSFGGVEHMDLGAFLARVAQKANLSDVRDAEVLTCGVFATIREQVSEGAAESIEHQLPQDIREMWNTCVPKMETTETMAQTEREPLEFEAPVEPMSQELIEEQVWGPKTDMPTGPDVEMIIAQTEAQVRDMGETMREEPMEERVHPPAEERTEMVAPPSMHEATAGPGSEIHYRSDPQLSQEIMNMLEENDDLEAASIDVFVQAGNVTLRGHVKSHEQREIANHIASKALGVGEIRNELVVEE